MHVSRSRECAGNKHYRQQDLPTYAVANQPEKRICSIINLLAGQTPQWRFPQDRVLTPKAKFVTRQTVNAERAGNGNQNACIPPEVIPAHSQLFVSAERQVNTESRNHEK